jgi:uncharacterized protein YcbK (DUF882 family)
MAANLAGNGHVQFDSHTLPPSPLFMLKIGELRTEPRLGEQAKYCSSATTKTFPCDIVFALTQHRARIGECTIVKLGRPLSTALFLATTFISFTKAPQQAYANPAGSTEEHRLRLYHAHTGERIDIVFRQGDKYVPEATARLDQFLRDHRTGDVQQYDPKLYDILWDLTNSVSRTGAEIEIICGYRSPWSNEFLRAHTAGVAKRSLHMQAKAIDIRLPGTDTLKLREAALALHRGGVGYYPHSGFVHVDTGRVTQWCFGCGDAVPSEKKTIVEET